MLNIIQIHTQIKNINLSKRYPNILGILVENEKKKRKKIRVHTSSSHTHRLLTSPFQTFNGKSCGQIKPLSTHHLFLMRKEKKGKGLNTST